MPLTDAQRQALRRVAAEEGVDPTELLQAAEQEFEPGRAADADAPKASNSSGRPAAERLLVGFLPFIKVRELRTHWLGLPDRIPDDELTCGEFVGKHGGQTAATQEPLTGDE